MGGNLARIFSETIHRSNHEGGNSRISRALLSLGTGHGWNFAAACGARLRGPDERVQAYVCIVAEFSTLCGLLMAWASENFALSVEPILNVEARSASPILVQLVRALADFRFQVS